MRVVFLGPPGVGKGTQGVRLAQHFGACHVSTGNMLRDAVELRTPLGMKAKSIMERGELVPDDLMIGLVSERMHAADVRAGFVLDGFPRTVPQAVALAEILANVGLPLDRAVIIDAPVEVIVERLSGRRTCTVCGRTYHVKMDPPRTAGQCDEGHGPLVQRPDDREEVIRDRLAVYCKKTAPLVDHYRQQGLLAEVNGDGSPDRVFQRLASGLGAGQPS